MRDLRLRKNLPTTHPEIKVKMPPYKDMQVVKRLNAWDDLRKFGEAYDFCVLSNSCRIIDVDDFTNLQQRFYIKGGDLEIWKKAELKSLWFMSIGGFGGTNRGTLIYAYEKFKNKKEASNNAPRL